MGKLFLAAAIPLLFAGAACGEMEKPSEKSEKKPQPDDYTRVSLLGDKAVFPEGVPKMPGTRLRRSEAYDYANGRRRLTSHFFVKNASSKQIVDFYSNALKQQGYEVSTTHADKYSNTRGTNDAGSTSVRSQVDTMHLRDAEPGEAYASISQDLKAP